MSEKTDANHTKAHFPPKLSLGTAVLIAGTSLLYGCMYHILFSQSKEHIIALLGVIPVIVIAYYLGKTAGIISGTLNSIITILSTYVIDPQFSHIAVQELFFSGASFISMGIFIGVLSELFHGLQIEIENRKKAEVNLRSYQEQLEVLVKERTKELETAREQVILSQKMEAIGELAGGVAHDFNNILGGIIGFADLINRKFTKDNPTLKKYITSIIDSSERAADLTAKLIAFAQKGKYHVVSVDMHELIKDVANLLEHSVDKRIHILQHLNAPSCIVRGDRSQLQDVILNIALNARDALSDAGVLTFATEHIEINEKYITAHSQEIVPGPYLMISITDTGPGIDDHTRTRIFDPFFTTKEVGAGSGMGLASAYGTIKNHNGSIKVYSELDVGTTFKVYLPLTEKKDEKREETATFSIKRSGSVLLIDDEEVMREAGSEMLKDLGFTVTTCSDGLEGVDTYTKHHKEIDLVILDIIMPRLNGYNCFLELQKINPEVKTIVCSGYSINGEAKEIIEKGALGFLQKPFDTKRLAKVIDKVMGTA